MPELPDVEGFRAIVERHALGRTVTRARVLDDWMLKDATPRTFARRLRGHRLASVARRGKILLASFGEGARDPVVALHFGMTGHPVFTSGSLHRWDRMVLDLDSGTQLRYRNMRRLGFIKLVERSRVSDLLWGLGPDPLEIPASWLTSALRTRRAPVKAVLLDQSFLAGIGNIYADESLFEARIDPRRSAASLDEREARRLHRWIRRVHEVGIDANLAGVIPPLRFAATRGPGRACPRCGTTLGRATLGGRTTYFCASCQR